MAAIPIVFFAITVAALLYLRYRERPLFSDVFMSYRWSDESKHEVGPAEKNFRLFRPSPTKKRTWTAQAEIKSKMQVAVSIILLCAALIIVLVPAYAPNDKHWAYGSLGTILGFWLRR